MKKPLLILAVSLIANVALLAVIRSRSAAPESNASAPSTPGSAQSSSGSGTSRSTTAGSARQSDLGSTPAQSDNPYVNREIQDLIARMRETGMPESLIQSAIQYQLLAQYQTRLAELYGIRDTVPPYWDTDSSLSSLMQDPKLAQARQNLSYDMQDAMEELFGADYRLRSMSEVSLISMQQQYGNLPMEKVSQIQQISLDYSRRQSEARSSTGSILNMLPEEREAYNRLQEERADAIRNLLTPEEYREFELNGSSSANTLRSRLAVFNPTEEEFLALFEIQKAFDDKYPNSIIGLSAVERTERGQAQQELEDQFIQVLSPERAEEYRLTTQGSGQTVARLVSRLGLPTSTVRDVLQVESAIQQQADAVRQNSSLDPQTRSRQLSSLAQQASSQLTEMLGATGFEAYQGYGGGWIQLLTSNDSVPTNNPSGTAIFTTGGAVIIQ